MTKAYKDMDISELSLERMRLKHILQNKPTPKTYRCTKASLEKVEKLLVDKVVEAKLNEKTN